MNCENGWKISTDTFRLEDNLNNESLYTLANGFIGMRGDGFEKLPAEYSKRGTFINGFYENSTIPYGESAYGFAKNMQTMLNVCDARQLELSLNREGFTLLQGTVSNYHRELDMKHALETISFTWESPLGRIVNIVCKNLVSLVYQHVAALSFEVTPVNFSGEIQLKRILDKETKTGEETDDPRVSGDLLDGSFGCTNSGLHKDGDKTISFVKQETGRTQLAVLCASYTDPGCQADCSFTDTDSAVISEYHIKAEKGTAISITTYLAYTTSQRSHSEDFEKMAFDEVVKAAAIGFEGLAEKQAKYMEEFWENADISIIGDEAMTQSMRFNMFQLLQSVGKDSYTSIASKGLSGEGYGGHYFWESEAYIAPMFMTSNQTIARNMLTYRYHILDKAREQARLLGHEKGALFSWRTIDGAESSAYFPAGSAQYHINADIAFAVFRYLDISQDMEFLMEYGLELMLETARLWIDVGHYSDIRQGSFCIDTVTGPDEYTAIVDNNCYTNAMARENLWNAVKFAQLAKEYDPGRYEKICGKIDFDQAELNQFQKAGDHMYIPYNKELGIHMQDDTFLSKKVLDLSKIPEEKRPLLLHYHPLFIYRHQVCKQADLILAEYFLPDRFSMEDKKRDYEYYEKLTTHDSSLSASVFSIMAAQIGNRKKAYDYFIQTVRTDLDDNQKNTKDGLHMANMAGAWACILYGFGGMKLLNGRIELSPMLPDNWKGYRFCFQYRKHRIEVSVTQEGTCYLLKSAEACTIFHKGKPFTLVPGQTMTAAE